MAEKPWHTPMDSVGPVAASRKPSMAHALDMINAMPAEMQYEGHGDLDGHMGGTGMSEDQNLMRRAVRHLTKNPR